MPVVIILFLEYYLFLITKAYIKWIGLINVTIPQYLLDNLEIIKDDKYKIYQYDIDIYVQLCKDLIAHGSKHLHIYTLNKNYSIILDKIGL